MESKLNDFLKEINEITPKKPKKSEFVWQECYDEGSGFAYYWNMKTDEVTWEEPREFKKCKVQCPLKKAPKGMYIPPKSTVETTGAVVGAGTSSISRLKPEQVKIYKVAEQEVIVNKNSNNNRKLAKNEVKKNKSAVVFKKPQSDSDEDEKIELITSYSGGTESENEDEITKLNSNVKPDIRAMVSPADNLSAINEFKSPRSGLPPHPSIPSVAGKVIETAQIQPRLITEDPVAVKMKKKISGFSLVAGYGDGDSDEEENAEIKAIFPVAPSPENRVSHSTLFPVTKPIDIKDFIPPPKPESPTSSTDFSSKAFKRKRKIGIELVNVRPQVGSTNNIVTSDASDPDNERKGFGYGKSSSGYPGFKPGGVMFVKSDVLNPTSTVENDQADDAKVETTESGVDRREVEDTYTALKEKLGFLGEGRGPVSPVQAMIIQIETLFNAMIEGGLKLSYLHKWLTETSAELIKLEKAATPEGWLLQWDRSQKRYYYRNQETGESQWDYPQPDVVRCDEAMDISTTPPPNPVEQELQLSPPLPPQIRSPSPPPPPIISRTEEPEAPEPPVPVPVPMPVFCGPALPPLPPEISRSQPLPPGVDQHEDSLPAPSDLNKSVSVTVPVSPPPPASANLNSVLDTFYSDIAAIEMIQPVFPSSTLIAEEPERPAPSFINPVEVVSEPPKKKKKKIKLVEGLAMKKKGVSKLVEKWKSVQYND